jgi:conjugative relaxase-like TrwC/TraI family protein
LGRNPRFIPSVAHLAARRRHIASSFLTTCSLAGGQCKPALGFPAPMFTMAKIRDGSTYLGNHLSANDYYAEGEKVRGEWIGLGAGMLGLQGELMPEQFEALRRNERPDSRERLTPQNRSDRIAFFDFQCSAQKSVSLMAIVGGDERLRIAHEEAAKTAFGELERFAARQQNTRTVRRSTITANLCAAAFTHDASRALDPQLHTHFVVANATRDTTRGQWVALNEFEMVKAIRYAGKVYQNELARAVKALGFFLRETRDDKGQVTGFEIEGVSDELCQRFAKRRAEIEREIKKFEEKRGREPSAAEIAQITRQTRSAKLSEISTPAVRARQLAQLTNQEQQELQALKERAIANVRSVNPCGREHEALQASVDHLFERQSVAREHEILAEALNQGLGAVELRTLKQALANDHAGIVHLSSERVLLSECATKRGLELERWSVAFINATRDRCPPLNASFEPAGGLSHEQRAAVRAILTTRDQVFSFRGLAGTGKTTTLKEVQRGLAAHRVFYIAPTASAAKVLQGEGFQNATTVEDFLQNVAKREPLKGAVVICDEAGLKSNRQGADLLHLAQQHNARVLLVGDVRQHVSVEAGDFLRVLETHSQLGRCEVAEIRRQQDAPAYKSAVMRMARGDARGGLSALDELGWVKEGQNDYLQGATEDYLRLTEGGKVLDRCLMVAPTWEENHRLTDSIRAILLARGQLAGEATAFSVHDSLRWTSQQKRNVRNYAPGQLVTFTLRSGRWQAGESAQVARVKHGEVFVTVRDGTERRLDIRQANKFDVGKARVIEVVPGDKVLVRANHKSLGLINGHVLTVDRIEPDQTITTREGVRIPARFNQWCHGYVITSHKSQGRTCEHVIVAAEKLDAKAAYVACSRGKRSCTVHTPDKQRLLDRLPEGNRRAALDVLAESQPRASVSILRRAEMWTRLFGQIVLQKAAVTRDSLRRRLEQTRQIVQRWTLLQKNCQQRQTVARRTFRGVRPGRAYTQHL